MTLTKSPGARGEQVLETGVKWNWMQIKTALLRIAKSYAEMRQ